MTGRAWFPLTYPKIWHDYAGQRVGAGLYLGPWRRAGLWLDVRVRGRWWGISVRLDQDLIGSKAVWTIAGFEIGWIG